MKSIKKTPKTWRINYVVTYLDSDKANACRPFVTDVLTATAILRKIDYAIQAEAPLFDDIRSNLGTQLKGIVADIFYFRSSRDSLSSVTDFRKTIGSLFQGYNVPFYGDFFDVHSMKLKYMKDYPFPKEFFRPKSYPYMEHHQKDGKAVLCIPESVVRLLSDEDNTQPLSN